MQGKESPHAPILGNEQMTRILRGAIDTLNSIEDLAGLAMTRPEVSVYVCGETPIAHTLSTALEAVR